MAQCRNVPDGASGSSTITTKLRVCCGASRHAKGGETFWPSRVYLTGIRPPLGKAGLVSERGMGSLPETRMARRGSTLWVQHWSSASCRIRVDDPLGKAGQPLVRSLLLVQDSLQHALVLVQAELLG